MMVVQKPEHEREAELEWGIGGQRVRCQRKGHSMVGIEVRMMRKVR